MRRPFSFRPQMSEDTPPDSTDASGTASGATRPTFLRNLRISSGSKALEAPAIFFPRVEEPVVQPVGPALPELDALGRHPVAAPVGRAQRLLAILLPFALDLLF